jgi:hypothetical protein
MHIVHLVGTEPEPQAAARFDALIDEASDPI